MSLFTSGYTGVEIDEGIRRTYDVFHNECELTNWYAPTPVNQRGIASGTTISAPGYFLDGWKLISGSCIWTLGQRLAVADESVVVQYMEKLYGGMLDKTYTFSIDTSDGIKSVTFKFPSAVSGATVYTETGITGYCTLKAGFEYRSGGEIICGTTQYYVPYIEITATDDIAITPYLEAHNVSTIANAVQPVYDTELRKCQRQLLVLNAWTTYGEIISGQVASSSVFATVTTNVMRTIPTTTAIGTFSIVVYTTSAPGYAVVNIANNNDIYTGASMTGFVKISVKNLSLASYYGMSGSFRAENDITAKVTLSSEL